MRLSQALSDQVTTRTRLRGHDYFAAGAVATITAHHNAIDAVVIGTRPYQVSIETDGLVLRASCTCPYFLDHAEICKHAWATILAAEARGLPLVHAEDALDAVVFEPAGPGSAAAGDNPRPAVRRAAQPSSPKSRWQQVLDSITVTPVLSAPTRQWQPSTHLLYVLDIAASRLAGAAILELMTQAQKANGQPGAPKRTRLLERDVAGIPGADQSIVRRLLGAQPHSDWHSGFGEVTRLRLDAALLPELSTMMAATGRLVARVPAAEHAGPPPPQPPQAQVWNGRRWTAPRPRRAAPSEEFLPLTVDGGPPWRFRLAIVRDEARGGYVVTGSLTRDSEEMVLAEPLVLFADGALVTRTRIASLECDDASFRWLTALRAASPIVVPVEARPQLIDALLTQLPVIGDAPPELHFAIEEGHPRPWLRLQPLRHQPERLQAEFIFDYGGLQIAAAAAPAMIRTADASRIVRRDRQAERALVEAAQRLGLRDEWSPGFAEQVPQIAASLAPRMIRTLVAQGWQVEVAGVHYRQPGSVAMHVSSGIDWFELEGHADYDGQQIALPALLAARARGDAFVTLADGSRGVLPEEWLRANGILATLGSAEGDRLRFKRSQVALLDALLAMQPAATWDDRFAHVRRELGGFAGVEAADPPPSFVGTLRQYQREGLGWLLFLQRFNFGGCLADDMGLGKTVMVLAMLARLREAGQPCRALVVAPRSLVFNWRQEAARFTPSLRVLEYAGAARAELREQFADADLILTTYGTMRQDAAALAAIPFEYVILDESQAIKNAASASAKAVRLLTARHRLALSGTPIENHLGELWSLFEFLNPGMLGSVRAFAAVGSARDADDAAVAALSRGMRPFILRRTKSQVAAELPEKTEQTVYCELERPQRALYDELRDHYRRALLGRAADAPLAGGGRMQILEALLRLRQAACHPGLIDPTRRHEPSAKLDALLPQITEAIDEGHKTLVFSQFTSLLAILRERLDTAGVRYEYLDGQTTDRQSPVERFQSDPGCRLFLISLKAGGVGLNLTAAEYVFLLDPWWNPAVETQAIDRAHRIGQTRQVFAYRLIARDTVEERVLELQQQKRKLADAILNADGGLIRDLRREDLELLLS